jgi:dCTP deaminase
MILPDRLLKEWGKAGGLVPFDASLVNPASVDLRLSPVWVQLDTGKEEKSDVIKLWPQWAILASTLETVSIPNDCAATVYLKSSLARRGLDHALAGWVDPGFKGTLTLELHTHRPITLMAGSPIIQIVLWTLVEPATKGYQGRYQHQTGPTPARPAKGHQSAS